MEISFIKNEIQILQLIDHPNIISFKDSIETETHIFIFQEFCEGKTLFDVIVENEQMKEEIAKKVFHQVIETIEYLQMKGISHRNIKLENIICTSDFQIKLTDFRFATSDRNLLNTISGSLQYCAPEVLRMIPYSGMIADMWSCGIVLFAMLNGKLPFYENTLSQTEKLIIQGEYLISRTVSKYARDLIKLLLEKNTSKRISPKEVLQHKWFAQKSSSEFGARELKKFDFYFSW